MPDGLNDCPPGSLGQLISHDLNHMVILSILTSPTP
jgi:hypothetical protein